MLYAERGLGHLAPQPLPCALGWNGAPHLLLPPTNPICQVYRKKPAIGHHYKRLRMKLAVACGLDKEYAKAALAKPEEEA